MKSIILAAGYGVRMKPLSDIMPKPLMPVLGKPVLQHIIEKINRCGVSEIGINMHHRYEMIENFCHSYEHEIKFRLSFEDRVLGVGGGIGRFRDFLKKEDFFLLHNGDILSNVDLEPVVDFFKKKDPVCVMILHDMPDNNNVGVEGNMVVDIRNTLLPGKSLKMLAYTGISVMSNKIFDYIPPDTPCDLIPVLLNIIVHQKDKVMGFVFNNCVWRDIGTIKNYFLAHRDILVEKKPLIDKRLIPEEPFFFNSGSCINENVTIKGFLSAGKNSVVKSFGSLENAVLWDGAVIECREYIKNSIVTGNGWVINAE